MIDILMQAAPHAPEVAAATNFTASTVSAFAAATAALVAAAVGGIQLYVGRRQSQAALLSAQAATTNAQAALKTAESAGRRRIAEFRQAWIDKVIDTLSAYVAELVHQWDSEDPKYLAAWKTTVALRVKLEILLNPTEAATIALLKAADEVRNGHSKEERDEASAAVIRDARELLKGEWVRIKKELQ